MPQPASSPSAVARPTLLVALVAAAIVSAHDPDWLSAPVAERARTTHVRPERVSRVKGRVLAALESLVAAATRRGRPASAAQDAASARAAAAEALLDVAAGVLTKLRVGSRALQDELVAAHERLAAQHGIDLRRFCAALGLSERTFRSWRARPARPARPPPPPPAPPPPAEKRPRPRRGRFALEVFPPGVAVAADTSDWELFGVPLKILAVQDPGARGVRTWEAAEVADGEDAQKVVRVVRGAVGDRPGMQLVTDQGTPYLARAARDAYEEMGLDHAPQREADPLGKATLERSFRSVKDALAPLVRLTAKIAEAVPALGSGDFAAASGRLLLGTFLDVDLRARRSTLGTAGGVDPDTFATLAEGVREKARAEERSRRLTLERIQREYDMPGSARDFVARFRGRRVEDLLAAEREMGTYACRCQARHCDRYFAFFVQKVAHASAERRSAERRTELARAAAARERACIASLRAQRREEPEEGLVAGLERVAEQWDAGAGRFVLGRSDPFRGALRTAWAHLRQVDPRGARDRAEVAWRLWAERNPDVPDAAQDAIRAAFERTLDETIPPAKPSTRDIADGMLRRTTNRRPPPDPHLRI